MFLKTIWEFIGVNEWKSLLIFFTVVNSDIGMKLQYGRRF